MAQKKVSLIDGKVSTVLANLSIPMAIGMVCMILVNIIDTFWVAQLGTDEIAAMTFTFPVVGLVINIALGLMIGTSTAVARAIGRGNEDDAAKLTTYALYFSLVIVGIISLVGIFTQDYLFQLLGADPALIPVIKRYMTIWYIGVVLLVIPLIANGALRAMGDAKTPMTVMILGAAANAILDPIFIYGFGPIPRMELEGAAIATLIARLIGMVYVFWILTRKTNLLQIHLPQRDEFVAKIKSILSVGIPAAITNALGPVAVGLITAVVASYGSKALAAYGIGARVDALILLIPSALGGALSPFVGQNWGAHLIKRVADAIRISIKFVLAWGILGCVVLFAFAHPIARVFSQDPDVVKYLVTYLQTIPVGYAFLASVSIASAAFNAVDKAVRSTWLSLLRSIIIAVPGAYIGGQIYGLNGVFLGIVMASVVSSLFGVAWLKNLLNPDGVITPELGKPLTQEESLHLVSEANLAQLLGQLLPPVLQLEDMKLRHMRGNVVGFFVGLRELAHIHPEGRIDLPLPIEVGTNLIRLGIVHNHPQHPDNGWYSHDLRSKKEVEETIWLIRLAHVLYELSERGPGDPVTQEELNGFIISEQCKQSLISSAKRWDLAFKTS